MVEGIIKGFIIGIALVVPGLSGSIFAVVLGVYEKMLDSISNFKKNIKDNIIFLLPLLFGIAIGILASTKLVLWVCIRYPIPAYLFFIGLVFGSIPLIFKKMCSISFKLQYVFLPIIGFIFLYLMTKVGEGNVEGYISIEKLDDIDDILIMLFAGFFSIACMLIPGVSGSIMLMVINQYGTIYNAVDKLTDMLRYMIVGNWQLFYESMSSVILLIPFSIGGILGILVMSKIINILLKKYEALLYYFVMGTIFAVIITLIQTGISANIAYDITIIETIIMWLTGSVCIILGVLCTIFLDTPEKI